MGQARTELVRKTVRSVLVDLTCYRIRVYRYLFCSPPPRPETINLRPKISVVGLGFVGLPLSVANASRGFDTVGVDVDAEKISSLCGGKSYIAEPGLDELLKGALESNRIHFTTDHDHAVRNSDVTFLTVGTPLKANGEVDLSYVLDAVRTIARSLREKKRFHLLVVKSTLPPLTTRDCILPILGDLAEGGSVDVAVNPEFLREGSAVHDMFCPHLIVIGARRRRSSSMLKRYYKRFYDPAPEVLVTGIETAELIKYANNAFLATKISFINSVAALCQGIPESDVGTVAYAMGRDPRIGPMFLKAGPGFGGSCLPKDLAGLIEFSQKVGGMPGLFRAVQEINDAQFLRVVDLMRQQKVLKRGNAVTLLGLAFKSGTDDVRDAVSTKLAKYLLRRGATVRVHDPLALEKFKLIFGDKISYFSSVHESLEGSDCCVILTEWGGYKSLRQETLLNTMKSGNVIDARRVLKPERFSEMNFKAIGLGS